MRPLDSRPHRDSAPVTANPAKIRDTRPTINFINFPSGEFQHPPRRRASRRPPVHSKETSGAFQWLGAPPALCP